MPYDRNAYIAGDAEDRRLALRMAAELESLTEGPAREGWQKLADSLYLWLRNRPSLRPSSIRLIPGAVTAQNGAPAVAASLNLTDNQQVTFTLAAEDAKGFVTADGPFTWSSPDDSAGAVITLTPSDDTTSCVVSAAAPGQATVQATDPSGVTGAELIIVTAGPVAQLVLTAGAPSDES